MLLKESEILELKKSTSELKEGIISIAAILNKHGKGILYFGINDDGSVIGQQTGKSTVKDISKSIADHIDPKIFPDITVQQIKGKNCIVIEFNGHEGLYSAYGRFYLRAGEEDRKLSTKEIGYLVEKKKNYVYSWGAEVSETSLSEVDVPALRSFIKRGKDAGRIVFPFDSTTNVLTKLHLVKGTKLLNAGRALFCKDNSIEVQAAIFAGKEKITFLDIQSFHGNLFELIDKSEGYVKEHINWRADLSGSQRLEIPEIPVRAIKEAIINSLCHRDFSNPKSNEIAIYRNRIEIFNPGQFPHEYSPEDFVKGNLPSVPLNPLVAEILYLSEDIEKWGSGLRRITEDCKLAKVKVSFTKIKSGFVVTFYRPEIAAIEKTSSREGQETAQKTVEKTRQGNDADNAIEGTLEQVRRRFGEKFGESSEKILGVILMDKKISAQEIAKNIGISSRAVEKQIAKLKKYGILKRIGPDKGGHWEIITKGK